MGLKSRVPGVECQSRRVVWVGEWRVSWKEGARNRVPEVESTMDRYCKGKVPVVESAKGRTARDEPKLYNITKATSGEQCQGYKLKVDSAREKKCQDQVPLLSVGKSTSGRKWWKMMPSGECQWRVECQVKVSLERGKRE